MKKTKTITVGYPVSSVYRYLKNIEHYAHHLGSACKVVDKEGLVASVDAPLVGKIMAVITTRVIDTKVEMSAKKIGTILTADLEELSESKTRIKLSMDVNPKLGFTTNIAIEAFAPQALDKVADELSTTDFEK